MKKRILSMFVAAAMLIGLVPAASASAAECTHHTTHSEDCLVLPEGETATSAEVQVQYCSYVCEICAAEEQEEQEQQEQPVLSVDEDAVIYNLGSMEIMVGEDESLAEGMPWGYKLFEADGSYTIELEDDAFFPYEVQFTADGETTEVWFETPDSEVEIGGHTFRVTSEGVDELAITQLGVWIGDEYVAAYPEEKEFTNQPFAMQSLLPLQEKELTLNLNAYDYFELKSVPLAVIFSQNNGTDSGSHVIWYHESDMDDYKKLQSDATLDFTEYENRDGFYLIAGSALQLDTSNMRYYVRVRGVISSLTDTSNYYLYKDTGATPEKITPDHISSHLSNDQTSIRWDDNGKLDGTYYVGGLKLSSAIKGIYEGSFDTIDELNAAIQDQTAKDVTALLTADEQNVKNSYQIKLKGDRWYQSRWFTMLIQNDAGDKQQVMALSLAFESKVDSGSHETGGDTIPRPGESDTYFRVNGAVAKTADGDKALQNVYILPYSHDTYYAFGYQTLFYLDDVPSDALAPTFTTHSSSEQATKIFLGHNASAGTVQTSGVDAQDFSNARPVHYSAASGDGKALRNYWVTFVKQHTGGAKLFVNGINGGEDQDDIKREVFLNDRFNNVHDIFIANVGDQELTGLKVTLENPECIKLDEYWTVGGTNNDTLAAFDSTDIGDQWEDDAYKLGNIAKIRLVSNGAEGEVNGKLTISADGQDPIVITLTGHAGNPKLLTGNLGDPAVKYVPYARQIMHNNKYPWNKVTLKLIDGALPDGIDLRENGELYGAPKETGSFTFTVLMENSDPRFSSDEATYTLEVQDNTNENVEATTKDVQGYEIEKYMGTLDGNDYVITAQGNNEFISVGEISDFTQLWIDGEKVPQSAYQADPGSTKITVSTQTLQSYRNKDSERHTIAAEFRQDKNPNNELKRTAQNFVLNVPGGNGGNSSTGGNGGSSGGSGGGSGSSGGGSVVTPQPVVEAPELITGTIQVPAQPAENNENVANVESEPAQDALNQVVDKAKESPAAKQPIQLVVEVTELDETMDQVSIRIPEEFLNILRDTDNASLKLDAGWLGDITLPETAIDAIVRAANGDAVISVKRTGNTVELSIEKGGQQLDTIGGGVKVSFGGLNPGEVIVLVRTNGQEEIVKKSVVTDGNVYALIGGSGTVKVINNSKNFVDVAPSDWFYNAVIFVNSRELFVGVNENEFAPKLPMSRAMLAAVLYRLEDGQASADACTFTDVSRDKWYAEAVAWAQSTGIISGYTDGRFGVNDKISREQLATILYRYAQFIGIDTVERGDISRFADAGEISAWANDAVRWAVGTGLIKGDGAGLNPSGQASRAEVAAIMMRFIENMVK